VSHTYASVDEFRKFIIDGGQAGWTESDALLLTLLEGASRRIDEWCDRSRFGSGFGPRTGTNTYPGQSDCELLLDDDLLAITSVTTHEVNGDSGLTLASGTDFYPSDVLPYRSLTLNADGTGTWGSAQRGNVIVGTWGYSNEVYAVGTGGTLTSSATSLIVSGGSVYAGQTLLIDSEQVYVTASGGTATIVRGVNGTTAAVHAASVAVSAYRYPAGVVTACLQLAHRRFRSAQGGLTGDFGGGAMPVSGHRDSETSILRSIGHLRRYGAE
jgi:hypothetical protein